MTAITYEVTLTNVPGLVQNFHIHSGRGYAYETATHYVHFYGNDGGWSTIHTGQTIIENKTTSVQRSLLDWINHNFGAANIKTMASNVGESVEAVWRPGLYYYTDIDQALNTSDSERRLSEQALRVLLEKLDDLFLYIEPDTVSMNTYSHKTRELLMLACTEVENFWVYYMGKANRQPFGRNYSTKDYVAINSKLFLPEFQCNLRSYAFMPPINPFMSWNSIAPTASLSWYDAYNKTKHNRASHFSSATFNNVLYATVACIVLYIVRFSPIPMFEEKGTFNSLVNQHFKFNLLNSDITSAYVPLIDVPSHFRDDIFIFDSKREGIVKPYTMRPLVL